jgi:septal ring factor EnvC (AmiA/AmiB activator)
VLCSIVFLSAATKPSPPRPKAKPVGKQVVVPKPLPAPDPSELKGAVPAKSLQNLPSTAEQYWQLNNSIAKDKPLVADARAQSETLAAEAKALREKLIDTARRIAALESDSVRFETDIARLTKENAQLSETFARDRVSVSRLLAVLERLQHDMPPAMALKPDDALGAVRGSMLVGATLPVVYNDAAGLARRIERLKQTRADLLARKQEAARTAV